jgi:hypothetical protein
VKTKQEYLGFVVVDEIHQGENTVEWVIADRQVGKLRLRLCCPG